VVEELKSPLSAQVVPFGGVTRPKMGYQVNRTTHQKFDSGCKYGLLLPASVDYVIKTLHTKLQLYCFSSVPLPSPCSTNSGY
jgi:hypothetical protein